MITSYAVHPYPVEFPCFNREEYGMELDMGLIQAPSDILTNTQRRSYTNLPTMIMASITIPVSKLYDFTNWMNQNIGLWINLPLAHPFMDRNNQVEIVPARILNFVIQTAYQAFGTINASASIQLSPTVFIEAMNAYDDPYDWVIGGTEPYPSPDWLISGRPKKLPSEWMIAGRVVDLEGQ